MFKLIRSLKRLPYIAAFAVGLFCLAPALCDAENGQQTYPPYSGAYASSAQHPRVFTTQADLNDLVTRINTPGTFSAQSFARLTNQIKSDLAARVDWDAAYSGCDLDIYLHTFSIEETRGYAGEVRTLDRIRSELKMAPTGIPPAGAALVASRLSLYAALVKTGAIVPAGAPSADQAAALAKRILLTWANHGFRDDRGKFRLSTAQFCEASGKVTPGSESAVGLQISRGVDYSVHAQDLLQSLGALNAKEESQLNVFHSAMFDLIRNGLNYRADLIKMPCDHYGNHVASQLTGLLATARLLDDPKKFNAALYGNNPSVPVQLPWTVYFNRAIYGQSDVPNACFPNTGPDSLSSKPFFQTPTVAPGEIDDRFRNANPAQGIGYPAGNLAGIYNAAEILKNAGFDAYGYRGAHQQSIEMATQYYACYGKYVGFYKTVTPENARACPDYQQYVGKVVNQVETSIVMGVYRFPGNAAIAELEAAAKAESTKYSVDPIRFGRWRD